MYKPLDLPEDTDPDVVAAYSKFVLSTGDVARAFGVTRSAITQWADAGTLAFLVPDAPLPQRRRFRIDDLVEFSATTGKPLALNLLPWRAIRHLHFTPAERDAILTNVWVSEAEAARQLGIHRSSLAHHLKQGRITGVRTTKAPAGGDLYLQLDVERVLNGERTLLTTEGNTNV